MENEPVLVPKQKTIKTTIVITTVLLIVGALLYNIFGYLIFPHLINENDADYSAISDPCWDAPGVECPE